MHPARRARRRAARDRGEPGERHAAAAARHAAEWKIGSGVFALTQAELAALEPRCRSASSIRPYHDLCDLGRYRLAAEPSRRLIYTTAENCPDIGCFPQLKAHLSRYRPIMEARRETRAGRRLVAASLAARRSGLRSSKLIILQMGRRPACVPAWGPACVTFSANVFVPALTTQEHLAYLAALVNSRLLWLWFRHHAKQRGIGLDINGHMLRRVPVRRIDFGKPEDRRGTIGSSHSSRRYSPATKETSAVPGSTGGSTRRFTNSTVSRPRRSHLWKRTNSAARGGWTIMWIKGRLRPAAFSA